MCFHDYLHVYFSWLVSFPSVIRTFYSSDSYYTKVSLSKIQSMSPQYRLGTYSLGISSQTAAAPHIPTYEGRWHYFYLQPLGLGKLFESVSTLRYVGRGRITGAEPKRAERFAGLLVRFKTEN